MITVVGYKNGQEIRHEICSDVFSADQKADEFKECSLYDEVHIIVTEEENGKK
jgi:hypothetical protein